VLFVADVDPEPARRTTGLLSSEHGHGSVVGPQDRGLQHQSFLKLGQRLEHKSGVSHPVAQVEIYFSIVQRRILTPNDFRDLDALAERLLDFQYYWESTAKPFEWKFTCQNLNELLAKFDQSITDRTDAV
jgi:hypothetical protein